MPADDEKVPQFIMAPEMEKQVKDNPALAKAMQGFKEATLNAMQGVQDGRYDSFDDAMEAITGNRPEKFTPEPRYELKYGYCLSVGPNPRGDDLLALITDGIPNKHPDITIMDVARFNTTEEAERWFDVQTLTEPWVDDPELPILLKDNDDDAGSKG